MPTGSALYSGSISASTVGATDDYQIPMTGSAVLQAGTTYCIVLASPSTSGRVDWNGTTTNSYSGGISGQSGNSGSTWGTVGNPLDMLFQEWGTVATTNYSLTGLTGTYQITGINALLLGAHAYGLICNAGSYILTGFNSAFSKTGWIFGIKSTSSVIKGTKHTSTMIQGTKHNSTVIKGTKH